MKTGIKLFVVVTALTISAQAIAGYSFTGEDHIKTLQVGPNGGTSIWGASNNFNAGGCTGATNVHIPANRVDYKELLSAVMFAKKSNLNIRFWGECDPNISTQFLGYAVQIDP